MKRIIISLTIIITGLIATGQELNVTNIEFLNNKVAITYNIADTLVGRNYTIRLYSSYDNYLTPLKDVSGDIGLEIKPGGDRTIIWDASKELGSSFNGNIALEVRARIYVPFINIDWFEDVKTLKQKHKYNITWTGGRPTNVLNFDLYRGETKITTFPNVANVGHYELILSQQVPPGKDYRFRISDTKNKDEVVYTHQFKINRRIPLAITAAVPSVLATAIYIYLSGLDKGPQEIGDPQVDFNTPN